MGDPQSDRREHYRAPVRLNVRFERGDKQFRLVSENLSLGGIFLKGADSVCTDGQNLQLHVTVPTSDGDATHEIQGTVVQVIPYRGVGVRFDWVEASLPTRAVLEQLITRLGMETNQFIHSEEIGLSTDAVEEPI